MKDFDAGINPADYEENFSQKQVILVCDDSTFALHAIKRALRNYYHVICASSGYEAVAFASLYNPDLIILDLMMYGMSGFEAIKKLKSQPLTKDIPVMFLTAADTPKLREEATDLCAVAYMVKPFNLQELIETIEKFASSKDDCYERLLQQGV